MQFRGPLLVAWRCLSENIGMPALVCDEICDYVLADAYPLQEARDRLRRAATHRTLTVKIMSILRNGPSMARENLDRDKTPYGPYTCCSCFPHMLPSAIPGRVRHRYRCCYFRSNKCDTAIPLASRAALKRVR